MGFLNPKSKELKNKDWGQEQILIRGAWSLRASFLILTSVYEDQEARNRRKWMPPASGPSHSRSPRRMGSLAARSLARESASRSLAQEGGVVAARRKGMGTRKASRIDAESVCLVQLFLWAIDRILLLLAHLGLAPWPRGPSAAAQLEPPQGRAWLRSSK